MNHQDLEKLLGLTPQHVTFNGTYLGVTQPPNNDATGSPTALVLDRWDMRRGADCLERSLTLQQAGLSPNEVSDFHAAAFLQDPELEDRCQDQRRQEFIKTLLETPEYNSLHESTQLNALASEMAATHFGTEYAKMVKEDQERERKQEGKSRTEKRKERDQARKEMSVLRAVGQALQGASQEVEELEDAQNALGCGPGQGQDGKLPLEQVKEMFQRTRNNPMLRKIIDLAGRFRRVAQAKQRQKVSHGYDDMVGVVQDGDVGRLLPHELALLATEETELDAMRRLVERQSLCREYRGIEKVGKGPIVVCVDESGSMSGDPVCRAKAFALAMAWVARHQRRWVCLCGYSGSREGTFCVMPPGKWDQKALLDWLGHFYGGGTTMDVPLDILPSRWDSLGCPKGKTDLLLLTDAVVHVPSSLRDSFNAWKKQEQVRCISLILESSPGDLAAVSEEVHLLHNIDTEDTGISRCLCI